MSENTIFTIGYERATLADLLSTLKLADIDMLVDIRELPISRKPGFSKEALSHSARKHGIEYLHVRELGDPKAGRDAARRGDTDLFLRIFRDHLAQDKAQNALRETVGLARSHRICLLCFERNPSCCHRAIVANTIASRASMVVKHLGVRNGLAA